MLRLPVMGSTLPPDGRTVDASTPTPSNVIPLRRAPVPPPHTLRLARAAFDFATATITELRAEENPETVRLVAGVFGSMVAAAAGSAEHMGLPPWHTLRRELRATLIGAEVIEEFKRQMQQHAGDDTSDGMDDAMSTCTVLSHLTLAFVGKGHADVE